MFNSLTIAGIFTGLGLLISSLFGSTPADPALGLSVFRASQGGTGTSTLPTTNDILIGNSSGVYDVKTLTAGSNVTINNSGSTVTISSSGGGGGGSGDPFAWTPTAWGVSTSTLLGFGNGFISQASSTATGLVTLTGGLTMEAGDTFTFNSDAFTDLTGSNLSISAGSLGVDDSFVLNTGDTLTVADGANIRGLLVTQDDTTNNPEGVRITQNAAENGLVIDCNADCGNSTSAGGALLVDNTGNIGAGIVAYSNNAAPDGRLMVLRMDNAAANQQVLYISNDGLNGGFFTDCDNASMTNNCGVIDSEATTQTAFGVTSPVLAQGVVKFTHEYTSGNDSGASALSLLLSGSGTAAQGIFLDSSVWTTGKLLNMRNGGNEMFVLDAQGNGTFNGKLTVATTSAASTFNLLSIDATGALVIPQAASPTVDASGEIALDTTDNQLLVGDSGGTARVVRLEDKLFSFTIASSSIEFVSGGVIPLPPEKDGYDISQFRCYVVGGTSVVVNISDGTNDTETITCATTLTSDTSVDTNSTATAGELMEVQIGTITGSPDYLSFTAYGHWTRE